MEKEVPRFAKVGIHLCVLMPVVTCFLYNAPRKKWYNKFLVGLYSVVTAVELVCVLKDLGEKPCSS